MTPPPLRTDAYHRRRPITLGMKATPAEAQAVRHAAAAAGLSVNAYLRRLVLDQVR